VTLLHFALLGPRIPLRGFFDDACGVTFGRPGGVV